MRDGWRNWMEHPPQIPWAPIHIQGAIWHPTITTSKALAARIGWIGAIPASTEWRPTGIYLQEYFEVTGQWV